MPENRSSSTGTARGGREIPGLMALGAAASVLLTQDASLVAPWGTGILLALVIFSWMKFGSTLLRVMRVRQSI